MKKLKIAVLAAIVPSFSLPFPHMGRTLRKSVLSIFRESSKPPAAASLHRWKSTKKEKQWNRRSKKRALKLKNLKKAGTRSLGDEQRKKEEKEREVLIKINDFKALQKQYLTEFQELEQGLVKKIRDKIFELVEEIGKRRLPSHHRKTRRRFIVLSEYDRHNR